MHLSAIVLGFAATVAGIDLRLYDNVMCNGGGFYHWENVRPDVCYTYINDHHAGVEWRAIPLDWSISGSIFKGDACTGGLGTENIYNTSTRCIGATGRIIASAQYSFVNNTKSTRDTCDVSKEKCNKQGPRPNSAGLADGTVYNIEGLDTKLLETFTLFMRNGSTAAELPEVFQKLVVKNPSSV